jgi:hypothetical protein
MSHAIIRRYTPPTCTLEIMANSSPLSRWMGQTVLKDLRFRLKLDDPKLAEDHWTVVQGDRPQLEALRDTVQAYVQNLLDHSQNRLDESFGPASGPSHTAPETQPEVQSALALASNGAEEASRNRMGISLQPKGLLAHDLTLGSLATPESGPTIALSTLQLFDLANALDDYSTDLVALPDLQRPSVIQTPPAWTKIAAVSLVAIGMTATVAKLFDGSTRQDPLTANQGASSSDQRIANQLPPDIVAKASPSLGANSSMSMPPLMNGTAGTTVPGTTVPGTPGKPGNLPKLDTTKSAGGSTAAGATGTPQGTAGGAGPVGTPGTPVIIAGGTGNAPLQGTGNSAAGRGANPGDAAAGTMAGNPAGMMAGNAAGSAESQAAGEAEARARLPEDLAQATRDAAIIRPPAASAPATGAITAIPQTDELRQYFQARWKPVPGVTQSLAYQLKIDTNGAIDQFTPLNTAAREQVEKSGIVTNEAIVSPLIKGKAATVRLELNPDGSVQTFLISVVD